MENWIVSSNLKGSVLVLVHIIMFGVVTSDDDVMSSFINPHGHIINTVDNIKYLTVVVLPLI